MTTDMTFPFGKYKDKPISEAPVGYLRFVLEEFTPGSKYYKWAQENITEDLVAACEAKEREKLVKSSPVGEIGNRKVFSLKCVKNTSVSNPWGIKFISECVDPKGNIVRVESSKDFLTKDALYRLKGTVKYIKDDAITFLNRINIIEEIIPESK